MALIASGDFLMCWCHWWHTHPNYVTYGECFGLVQQKRSPLCSHASLGIMRLHIHGHLRSLAGSVHDARVLTNSKLFQEAEDGTLLPNTTKSINGIDVPLLSLGDPPYPMLPWLMKPYTDNGWLTVKQLRFNYRLNRAGQHVKGKREKAQICLVE